MRRAVALALLLIASFPASAAQNPPATPRDLPAAAGPAGTASLSGTVRVLIDRREAPVRRARVLLLLNGATVQTIDTDTTGAFRADQLAAGAYRVVVDKPGFVPLGKLPLIDVADGQAVNLTVNMQPGAAIEGRLTLSTGEPAMGITVSAVRLGFGPYGKTTVAAQKAMTDDLGRFRVHTLAPGEYFLEAAPDPLRLLQSTPTPVPVPKPAKTLFPGTTRLNDAQVISVAAGQDYGAGDMTMAGDLTARITVRVATSAGTPAPQSMSARLQRVGAPPGEVRCWLPNPDSPPQIDCTTVPPGDYWVLATARTAPGAELEFGAMRITIEGRDQTYTVTTAPGMRLTGRVETDDGSAVPGRVQIAALESEYEFPGISAPGAASQTTPPAQPGAGGAIVFPSLAGPRVFRANGLPAGWAIAGVWLNDREISDVPTTIAAGATPPQLRVVLTSKAASVSGVVGDAVENKASPASRVIIFSEDASRWGARSRFIKTAETGLSGSYRIDGLLPGQYFAAAVDALAEGGWEDPDVLRRLLPGATRLTIAASDKQTLNLRLR